MGSLCVTICKRGVREAARDDQSREDPFQTPRVSLQPQHGGGEMWRVQMMVFDTQIVLHLHEPQWLSADKVIENQEQFLSKSKYSEEAAQAGDFILPTSFRTTELLKFPMYFCFDSPSSLKDSFSASENRVGQRYFLIVILEIQKGMELHGYINDLSSSCHLLFLSGGVGNPKAFLIVLFSHEISA